MDREHLSDIAPVVTPAHSEGLPGLPNFPLVMPDHDLAAIPLHKTVSVSWFRQALSGVFGAPSHVLPIRVEQGSASFER